MDLLEGVRIIDWSQAQQGPVATTVLGSWGADVIKIEHRERGDLGRSVEKMHGGIEQALPHGLNTYFEVCNLNKRCLAIDLKKPQGKEVICRLVEKADVFVHNFKEGTAERLGIDYGTLSRYNPRLIYATAGGYGPEGPDSTKPAFDYAVQARSGLMDACGEPGMPPIYCSLGLVDQAGALGLVTGILAALLARERFGVGQEVNVSLLGSAMFLMGLNIGCMLLIHEEFPRFSRLEPTDALWNHYECADGRWICPAMLGTDEDWEKFCTAMGLEELGHDPRFQSVPGRAEHGGELAAELRSLFKGKPAAEWDQILTKEGLGSAVVQKISELPSDPQVIANKYVQDFDHPVLGKIKVFGNPFKLSKMPAKPRLPAPVLGQHNEEILLEADYTWDEIVALKDQEVI
ncbi:CaiB/BaiF CoA transferase family protein [Chloroflexota bacterium]